MVSVSFIVKKMVDSRLSNGDRQELCAGDQLMKKKFLILSFIVSMAYGCGKEAAKSYRNGSENSFKGIISLPVLFSFSLPPRNSFKLDEATQLSRINGYAWRVDGQGKNCQDSIAHESFGSYEDGKKFSFNISGTCSYFVTVMLGELASTKLSLTDRITYIQQVQPIMDQQCVSCHTEFSSFAGVRAQAKNIVASIEAGTMPPSGALADEKIALFLAWADAGFAEKDLKEQEPNVVNSALSEVFYRNNYNDRITDYELLGRTSYELRRSLWIQPAAEALGLQTTQVFTAPTDSSEKK